MFAALAGLLGCIDLWQSKVPVQLELPAMIHLSSSPMIILHAVASLHVCCNTNMNGSTRMQLKAAGSLWHTGKLYTFTVYMSISHACMLLKDTYNADA